MPTTQENVIYQLANLCSSISIWIAHLRDQVVREVDIIYILTEVIQNILIERTPLLLHYRRTHENTHTTYTCTYLSVL